MTGILVQDCKIIDGKTLVSKETARKIPVTSKTYVRALQKAGVTIAPSLFATMN